MPPPAPPTPIKLRSIQLTFFCFSSDPFRKFRFKMGRKKKLVSGQKTFLSQFHFERNRNRTKIGIVRFFFSSEKNQNLLTLFYSGRTVKNTIFKTFRRSNSWTTTSKTTTTRTTTTLHFDAADDSKCFNNAFNRAD